MKINILLLLVFIFQSIIISQVSSDQLKLYFPFNGNANDEGGNDNNGTISGAILTEDRFGNSNSAYWFDGDNDYIEVIDNESLSITGALTMSLWYRYDGKPQSWGRILSKAWGSVAPPYMCYGLSLDDSPEGNQKVLFQAHLSSTQTSYSNFSTTSMTVGEWYHLAGVYDPANSVISLYVNGIKEAYATTGNSTIANTTGHLRVADDQQTFEGAKGVLDDIRIYARALSQSDILSLYYEVPSNKDGALDISFGNSGVATTTDGPFVSTEKIQSDGKIVVAGTSNDQKFAVTRYNSDGSLDLSFGNGGIVITQVGNGWNYGWALALQSDGRIVLVGTYEISTNNSGIALVRYNSDGSFDISFGNNGIVTIDITGGYDYANSIAIQSNDQKILIGGSGNGVMIARFIPDGTLDINFGVNGVVTLINANIYGSNAMALQQDGKILVSGDSNNGIVVIRFNSDGSLDTEFGNSGIAHADIAFSGAMVLQTDGKIVVGGNAFDSFTIIRFNSDGTLDNSFGSGGIVQAPQILNADYLRSVAMQADGKILSGGFSVIDSTGVPPNYPQIGMSLMRFETNGNADNSFGIGGVAVVPLGEYGLESGRGLAIQNDHKILLAGYSIDGAKIARFNITSISSVEETTGGEIPEIFVLEQNYPNPFNPSTKIVFSIPQAGEVKLEVFNLLGENVTTLVDEFLSAGNYEAQFNAASLSSGVYLYTLQAGGFLQSKKMILIK